jgi:hypothetical protein
MPKSSCGVRERSGSSVVLLNALSAEALGVTEAVPSGKSVLIEGIDLTTGDL